ncbi:hypothetical protein PR202_ga18867 [Eleusine coracana subsp. coracana]|uniref:DOG1 domain-containing protein n=1 Tax=Eleusine coracana subsp. coracana TaxID=191504 RepID=A0AAV5CU98_ELECO|nr:hypothetical protein PR202_ga18867 [Eleusine coracana subsp. coracana]
MTSASAQFAAPVRMGVYERPVPVAPIGMWSNEPFKVDSGGQATSASTIMEPDNKFDTGVRRHSSSHQLLEDVPQGVLEPARSTDQETSKPPEKVLRRLAQNREAARKSRLRKKGVYANGNMGDSTLGFTGPPVDAGVAAFEIEYSHWVDEQNRHTAELRNALQGQTSELELRMLVETGLNNYQHLFGIKSIAAHSDVFYIISGMWKTPIERFFLWIGGFRPSEVLKVARLPFLSPHRATSDVQHAILERFCLTPVCIGCCKILRPQLEPLTEPQRMAVCGLQQTSTQAEDALFQGMEKLQQNLTEALTVADPFVSSEAYMQQMVDAVGKLKELVGFVTQADHLRQTTLQQMHKILTTRQAARGLLALGDYFQRLRALSQLWAARPRESAIS